MALSHQNLSLTWVMTQESDVAELLLRLVDRLEILLS